MCQHKTFCAECAPTDGIIAYTEGRTHVMPAFGDYAQFGTAQNLREDRFNALLRASEPSACLWPEYRQRFSHFAHVRHLAKISRSRFCADDSMPENLRAELQDMRRIPRKRASMQRHIRRAYIRWVGRNLAMVEQAMIGQTLYAHKSPDRPRKEPQTPVIQPELCQVAA